MEYIAIIPARFASTRFPGKPLAILGGQPVIQRVYEQVRSVLDRVYVATDDQRIYDAVTLVGGSPDVVINVQGDEPFIQPSQLRTVMEAFDDPVTQIATLGKRFESIEAVDNPNSPKIVLDNDGFALYFSRSPIPFVRGKDRGEWLAAYPFLKHIGLYAYRADVLREVTRLPQSSLELAESLEQLRWLQNGYKIKVGLTDVETVGIDTPEDLHRAERFLATRQAQ